ncbi:MAG: RDD family protein [Nostocoides sp.]
MGYLREENITGEGVALELPVAGIGPRALARLLDMVAQAVLAAAMFFGATALLGTSSSGAVAQSLLVLVLVTVLLIVPATIEVATRGKSPGRYALGIRIVRDDGGPITGRQALLRALVAWVEIWLMLGGPALVSAMVTPRAKRLGDVAAGTYAISERHALALGDPPVAPAALAAWARQADLGSLPTGLALAIRAYLDRSARLTPAAAAATSRDLLEAVLPHVAPPPPDNVHPDHVLAAVLAERRIRDAARLSREQVARERFTQGQALR